MAITGVLHKIVWGGRLATTEQWTCSIHFLSPVNQIGVPLLMVTALTEWMGRSSSKCSSLAFLDYIKFNAIDPQTGKYLDATKTGEGFLGQGALGGQPPVQGQNVSGDPAVSVAASTVTNARRGRASKGRFYPPSSVQNNEFGLDGHLSDSLCTTMATSAAQLITDLNGAADGSCVVFSKIGQSTNEIVGIRVGSIADHQSRRRRQLKEKYSSKAVS